MKTYDRSARPRHTAVAVLVFAVAWLWLAAGPVSAHPYLVQTVPGPGVVLPESPPAIQVGFTERVVLEGSSLRLERADGQSVDLGPVREPKEGPGLAADVSGSLGGEVYRVRWVVLGDDGHTSSGDFAFGVNGPDGRAPAGAESLSPTGGPSDQAAAWDGPVRIALRWLGLLGASLLVGGATLATRLRGRMVPEVAEVISRRWTVLARVAWLATLAGSLAALAASADAGAGEARLSIVLATSTGVLAIVRLAGVLLVGLPGVFFSHGLRRDQYLGMAGAFFLAAEAIGGHITALTGFRLPAIAAQSAHLVAAATWVGGLGVMAYAMAGVASAARAGAWRAAATAYRPVATASGAIVIGTGVVASVREVQHRYFLLWSAYGRFLLAKWTLVAGMLLLGALAGRILGARRRAGPAVAVSGGPPASRSVGRYLRAEAVLGVAVLVVAASLAGVAQGRGQPLPAQRGSVIAGPSFANAVVGGGLARLALSPASPGRNRLTVLMGSSVEAAVAAGSSGAGDRPDPAEPEDAAGGDAPRQVDVSFTCACVDEPVTASLDVAAGAWRADVDLPAAGLWRATLAVDGNPSLAPVTLRVEDAGAPGAPPVVISSVADLSGPNARRCRSFQLGMALSLAFLNANGGVGGRKVVVEAVDDGGDQARARELARAADGAHLAAPCGAGAAAAAEGRRDGIPVVVADAQSPPVGGPDVFRLAGDPYAEGWALGRTVARTAFVVRPDGPRRISVMSDAGDPSAERAVAGVRAALALDPAEAARVEGTARPSTADVEVEVFTADRADPLPVMKRALDRNRFVLSFLRSDPARLGPALDQLTDDEIVNAAAVYAGSRAFDEGFYRSSRLSRRGDVVVLGEVAPDAGAALLYSGLVFTIYPGEQPSVDGLRGFMAGKAIASALEGGSSREGLSRRLQLLGLFTDGIVSGWSPKVPSAGSWRFFLYRASFVPGSLKPGQTAEPGRYFAEGGAWGRVATGNVGLCGPQLEVGGRPPPCDAPSEEEPDEKGKA